MSVHTASAQVRAAMARSIDSGASLKADHVAHGLSVSTGHLRRLLRAEGTTLLAVRDTMLHEEAVAALERGDSIDATAKRLGFADQRSFRRAFKRWTGSTPGTFLEG